MDPTAARLNKRYLRVALLGTVPTPDATEETTLREPTISAPQEISIHSRRLPFSLEELRIIDSRTSETLATFDSPAKVDTQNDSQLANSTSMPKSSTVSGVAPIHDGPDTVKQQSPIASANPMSIRVDGDVQAALLINEVKPPYPPLACQARIQGTVKFNAVIGKDGRVQNLTLVSGHPLLVAAAQQAVQQWVYRPTLLGGEPVQVITTIEANFTLMH